MKVSASKATVLFALVSSSVDAKRHCSPRRGGTSLSGIPTRTDTSISSILTISPTAPLSGSDFTAFTTGTQNTGNASSIPSANITNTLQPSNSASDISVSVNAPTSTDVVNTDTTPSSSPSPSPSAPCDPRQVVVDPGFEDGGSAWTWQGNSTVMTGSSQYPAHNGTKLVYNIINTPGETARFEQQLSNLVVGQEYELRFWWSLTDVQGFGFGTCDIDAQVGVDVVTAISAATDLYPAYVWSQSDPGRFVADEPDPLLVVFFTCFAFSGFTGVEALIDDVEIAAVCNP